ncbi:hypothetical protein MSG28_001743 [Choristoneura fumiferana]|uniref:Uncharacterized protein n=1 Tax=Choristoneura fumiferana TaxID=7141 RepID=A0ACC0KVX9_CHOFU|nr:hypothetical protein MSG28_001743 [Choristoneura fumiferana]
METNGIAEQHDEYQYIRLIKQIIDTALLLGTGKAASCSTKAMVISDSTVISTHNKAYPCPEKDCTKAYTNKSHLDRHINSVHKVPDNDMLYSCELCLKEFVSLHEKKKHVRSHKTHRCNQCPATFNLWSKYQKHVKNDHLGKEFICNECDRHFKQRSHMVRHVRTHLKIQTRTFPCPYDKCERGIPIISKDRKERIAAIAAYLQQSSHGLVCLQEIWSEDDYIFLKEKLSLKLPYSHYFYSGVLGSGLCVFSKWIIQDVFFHQWPLNGYIHKIHHGDWFGGKGVSLCQLQVGDCLVNIYCTHLHAEYHEDDIYLAHRVLQAHSAAEFVKLTSASADVSILAGDLNTGPGDLSYSLITKMPSLIDPYYCESLQTNPSIRPASGTSNNANNSYSNKFAASCCPDGKRIDHILFYHTPQWQAEIRNFGNPLEDRVPGQPFSYSDHNAVTLELRLCRTDTTSNERPGPVDDVLLDQTIAKAYQVFTESANSLNRSKNVYLYTGLFIFMFLVATVGCWPNQYFFNVIKLGTTAVCFYYIIMGTLWNRIEMNSLKERLSALDKYAEIRNFGNPLEDRVPGQPFSYSDHNAVTLELRLCRTDTTSNERPGPVDDVLLDQTIAKAYQASTASKEETPKRGSTLLKCTTCNTFSTLSSRALTTHMAQCSPDNNNVAAAQNADRPHRKLFECDVCNMKFSNGANMRRHKMRHTGVKPYECRVCQKRFFRKDHLAEHFTTHTKSLPYHCPICNRGFQRQIAMRAHFQNEHVGQHDLVKTCPLCSYRAPTMKSLRVHFFNRHGIDLDNPGTGNNSVSLLAAGIANAAYADGTMDASAINALGALGSGLSVSVAAAYSDSGDSNGERSVDNATPPMHYLTPHVEISMADNNETFSPGQSNHNSDSRMNGEGPSSPQSGDSAGAVASSSLSAQLPAGITPSITLIPIKQEPNTQEESGGGESQGEANGGDKRGVSSSLSSLIKGGVITSTHGEAAAAPASLVCSFCAITFPDSTLYFLHKGCHCDSNPWKCNICGEQCCNVYEFNSHLLSKSHQ